MANCNDITIVKVDYEKRPNAKEKKQSIYEPTIITDKIVTNLFSDPKSNNEQFSELFTDDSAILGKENYKSVQDKTKSLRHFDKDMMPFGEKIGKITDGKDIRDITIAISQLISAKKSELDLTDKHNLTAAQIEQVMSSKFDVVQTSYSNMARNIGREILKSRGYRIVPKNENGIKQELQYEIQLGEEALRKLPKEILDIREDGSIINRGFRNPDPKNEYDVMYSPDKIIQGVKTIAFGSIIKEDIDGVLTESENTNNFRIMSKLAATRALLVPSNQAIPFSEAQEINQAYQDITMTENGNQTLEQFQKNPLVVDDFFKEALGELRDMVLKDDKSTTKNSMIALANWVFKHPEAKNIFGTIDQAELAEIMMGDPTGIEQAFGKSNSIVLQFNRIFDSWDKVQGEVFYTYQTAIQNRAHAIPQTLNYQTDKVVSRPILVSKNEQTLSDSGTKYMLAFIEDETGLDIREMLVDGVKPELDKYINAIDNGIDSPLDIMLTLSKDMDNGAHPIGDKVTSAWEAMSYIKAIKDLRNGIQNGQPVKTRFMPSPDATASGAVITVSQASRYGGESADIYNKLASKELKDVYDLSLVKLDAFLETKDKTQGIGSMSAAKGKTAELLQGLIDNGVVKSTRELIKYPFIKYTYGQSDFNNRLEVAKEIVSDMIDSNNINAMKSFLQTDDNGKATETLPENTTERRIFLTKRLSEKHGVTDTLVNMVAESIGEKVFGQQKKDLTAIYELLEETSYAEGSLYKNISIIPPLAWLDTNWDLAKGGMAYEQYRDDYSAPLEKYFEAVVETGKGEVTTIKKRYPNVTSILVLLQHMTDAAIMYRSNDNMFKSDKHKNYTGGLKLLHDSVGSEVEYAMDLEPEYRSESTFVNSNYDFVEAALAELKYARSKVFANQKEVDIRVDHLNAALTDTDAKLMQLWDDIKADRELNNNYDVENTPIEVIQSTDTQKTIDMRHEMGILHASRQDIIVRLDILAKAKLNPELATKLDETISDFDAKLPAQIQTKKDTLSKDISTSFGVKPKLLEQYEVSNLDTFKVDKKPKPKAETKTKEKKDPVDTTPTVIPNETAKDKILEMVKKTKDKTQVKLIEKAFQTNPNVKIKVDPELQYGEANYDLGSNTISTGNGVGISQITHELVHAATAQKIETDPKYRAKVQKLYNKALKDIPNIMEQFENLPKEDRLHEFMAAGISNYKMKNELSKVSYGRKILNAIKRLVLEALGMKPDDYNTVYGRLLEAFSDADYKEDIKNPEKVLNFLDVVTEDYKPYKPEIKKSTGLDKQASNVMTDLDRKAANVIKHTIDLSIDHTVKTDFVSEQHERMMETSQVYRDTFNAVTDQWENNTFIGKLKFYLDLDENARRKEFNILNTQATIAEERKAQFEADKMNSLYKQMKEANFQKSEVEGIYTLLSEVPIANLAVNNIAKDIFKGKLTIEEAIDMVLDTSDLTSAQKTKYDNKAKELAAYYIDKNAPKNFTTDKYLGVDEKEFVGQLTALYSMQKVPNINNLITKIMSSQARKEVVNNMLQLASATKVLDNELDGTISYALDKHNGNLNYQVFDNNVELKRVSRRNIDKELQRDLGWKILQHPTKEVAGILYRDGGDLTYQAGIGTQTRLQPNLNVAIPDSYAVSKNNSVPMLDGSGSRIILTNDQLKTIGLTKDPVASLVKGYSHRMMLQETQSIRETLVNEFSYNMVDNTEAEIVNDIKTGKHNWYIQLPKGMTLSEMDPLIQKKYKLSRARSDANDFSKKMTLIRSDMSDFVEGYGEIQVGAIGTKLNKAFSILKKAVLMQKIHWVITSPVKIGMDAVSNTAYLLSRNIPITTIYEKTKSVSKDMVSLTKLREDLLHAEFRNRANPSKARQRKVIALENKIKNHRLASAYFRGFISSIAIDLTQKNEHTASGIHKDVGMVLNKIFKNDDKSLNRAGKAIMGLSKFGINGEDLLLSVANLVAAKDKEKKRIKGTVSNSVAETLEGIAENIKAMKDEGDIASYLQEYMMTPGSSGVAVGSALVQAPDVISKVILQEFLVEQKVREYKKKNNGRMPSKEEILQMNEDASLESVQSFIDYKMNIPRELRFLEQTGITSFISFWARIQKVMLVSLRNNPVNALTTILLNELLLDGDSGATIFDSSVLDKWGSGSLLGGPNPGLDVLLPTKIAG